LRALLLPAATLLLAGAALAQPSANPEPTPPPSRAPQGDAVERALVTEMERATQAFAEAGEPPYYLALAVENRQATRVAATAGTLMDSDSTREAFLDVEVRVGTPELDSTHPLRGMSSLRNEGRRRVRLPIEEQPSYPLHHAVWKELDARWRNAVERIVVVRANQNVKVEEEMVAPDFELREPVNYHQHMHFHQVDVPAWEERLRQVSLRLDDSPQVHGSRAVIELENLRETFVDSEGSRLVHGGSWVRVALSAQATAEDGDELSVSRILSFRGVERLPDEAALNALADEARDLLEARLAAPRAEPYTGPVLLDGKAAAVFFHEVFGHRVEGHRQKLDDEGKTFLEYVGRPILPDFLDVYDDPTIAHLAGEDLNGHYAYDDEGVAAQRAILVEDGIFLGFLMGRSPLPEFQHSNGHGRRSTGRAPTSRMGNTIVEANQTVPRDRMRAMLVEEARAAGLPYGLYVEEIAGGFTMTGRVIPNAFNVRAITTWKIYTDGRPDELVRGIDMVGTPLVAFGNIAAAGDDMRVFNGTCGAESGWVPVSAVSPSLLIRGAEFQLKEKGEDRPPLLPKPQTPERQPQASASLGGAP